ncbi:response regulator [Oscillatoriales cyanobacterium LEGE 11467]|uniref:Response regulator n=1 Tax=Zarconia navalis LEGE 11467 TaxID=1828826 RepID=A0A928Z809_9CYAN|nr:adenylate/guanylate cyclase domain-containing protein [Zarconia navalis]MBE9039341.1 response regulator [Zarconia navalis LEGE 11467]
MTLISRDSDRQSQNFREISCKHRCTPLTYPPNPKNFVEVSTQNESDVPSHPDSFVCKSESLLENDRLVILCVDDELMILNSLKRELELAFQEHYLIEIAQSGEEALEVFEDLIEEDRELALIISDCVMPRMRGDKLLQRIHEISPQTIKIMLTGQADIEAISHAINHANLYRYLSKPWHSLDLKLTIQEAIDCFIKKRKLSDRNEQLRSINEQLEKQLKIRAQTIEILSEREQTLDRLNYAYQRFVPNRFLQYLQKDSIIDVELGDRIEQKMSVLCADIRNFTAFSEQMSPEDNFKFINAYLSRMEPAILDRHGFIDKYIGDGIMAMFDRRAENAVKSGIEMLQTLKKYNQTRKKVDRQPISIGIGIDTGNVLLGTVGSRSRIDSAAIGEVVSCANRLEQLTKYYRLSLLISQETLSNLENSLTNQIRKIDRVRVNSQSPWQWIFEVFDADVSELRQRKLDTKSEFERAVSCYHQKQFSEARKRFQACWRHNPKDTVVRLYLQRTQQQIKVG